MRPRRLRALIACAFPAAITVGALAGAGVARADVTGYTIANADKVCAVLDQYPTFAGVTGVMDAVIEDGGFTVGEAASVVVDSVWHLCPRHQRLLLAYGNTGRAV